MIFADSYETTVGSAFVTKNIVTAIKQAIIHDNVSSVDLNVRSYGITKPAFITGVFSSESDIPLFTHPITVITDKKEKYLFTDLRLFLKKDALLEDIEKGIKNLTEYNFAKSRGILNLLWLNDGVDHLRLNFAFASKVFSYWLAETISKTYSLDFKDQTIINIISSVYYQSLFMEEDTFDEATKQKMAVHTINATQAPSDLVFGVLDNVTRIHDIKDYCELVKTVSENIRLKDFNLAALLTILRNSWYGTNAKEIVSVALEHPPTWIAVVYVALSERTYRNSLIYKIAERVGKRGLADEFMVNYKHLIQDNLVDTRRPDFNQF